MGKCGTCDKKKDGNDTTMKGQTSSFELQLASGKSIVLRDMSQLEAQAMLTRMGGGTLKKASS